MPVSVQEILDDYHQAKRGLREERKKKEEIKNVLPR